MRLKQLDQRVSNLLANPRLHIDSRLTYCLRSRRPHG